MNPVRIQRKREKGWKMPPNTVYVGRPTKWGNPFTGLDAVERYKQFTEKAAELSMLRGYHWHKAGGNVEVLKALVERDYHGLLWEVRGKNLACWCPLTKKDGTPNPCHADILLKIANE